MDNKEDIFVGVGDIFNGVTVAPNDIPGDVKEFERRLTCMPQHTRTHTRTRNAPRTRAYRRTRTHMHTHARAPTRRIRKTHENDTQTHAQAASYEYQHACNARTNARTHSRTHIRTHALSLLASLKQRKERDQKWLRGKENKIKNTICLPLSLLPPLPPQKLIYFRFTKKMERRGKERNLVESTSIQSRCYRICSEGNLFCNFLF